MNREIVQGLRFGKKQDLVKALEEAVERGYLSGGRGKKFIKKETFAPSSIAGYNGVCFAAETEFVTDRGIRTLGDCVGESVRVWTGLTNDSSPSGWLPAIVQSFGIHPLRKITIKKNGVKKEIYVTGSHRWIVEKYTSNKANRNKKQIITTDDLVSGDRLWNSGGGVKYSISPSPDGIRAGFVYGDGDIDKSNPRSGARVTLFGDKDLALLPYFYDYKIGDEVILPGYDVSSRRVSGLPRAYKDAPRYDESASYLYGWLVGYFAADGNIHSKGAASLSSASIDSINVFRDVCAMLNIKTGSVSEYRRIGYGSEESTVYTVSVNIRTVNESFFLNSNHKKYFYEMINKTPRESSKWEVVSVEKTERIEEVFCVVQPDTERFTLADDILTKNCPRFWYQAFDGAEFDDTTDALGFANMANGSAAHDRLQKVLQDSGILVEAEREFKIDDPPIRGYIDAIVKIGDEEIVGEIKTTRDDSYMYRRTTGKPMAQHLYQILIYMYAMKMDKGFLLYENKNDQTFIVIPIEMNDENRKRLEDAFVWLRRVRQAWVDRQLPMRMPTSKNKSCKVCPLWSSCWDNPSVEVGQIRIEPMEVPPLA